jgi:hypothetical protein
MKTACGILTHTDLTKLTPAQKQAHTQMLSCSAAILHTLNERKTESRKLAGAMSTCTELPVAGQS